MIPDASLRTIGAIGLAALSSRSELGTPLTRLATRALCAAGLLAALLPTLAGCFRKSRPALPHAGGTSAAACRECHEAIYQEWSRSAHAAAFTREEYRRASRDHPEGKCLRCHVPASLDRINEMPVRARHRDEGVTCEGCHLKGDAYAAPKQFTAYTDHPVVEEPLLVKSDFCGKCHEAIFKQWSDAPVKPAERKTCQQCHMAAVRRRTVSGSAWHRLHKRGEGRRHDFAMERPEPDKPHVTLAVALTKTSAEAVACTVTVTNVAAHHALPSGEFGFRELAVVAALVDRYGVASAKQVTRFVAQKRSGLPFGEPRTIAVRFAEVPADVEALEVRLVRSSFSGVEAVLGEQRIALRGEPEEIPDRK